ncbi:MAG: ABC transporter ATP-binding protein [Chloroflexi bacterium]|nr:MAG: ABC transporter ATP-binding protein [Chloroflexota bacterium]RLC92033.1 MAG: ABC transporter ATP-binding protein [Chloroflexota bacterium]HEY67052.1 ABC transporter ATP-binding protein [Thermoflexia bacterium]
MSEPVLQIRNLSVDYPTRAGVVRAVDDVSLTVYRGEVLGLVGESGCGKSTLGMAILRLLRPPGKIVAGEIVFNGRNLLELDDETMRHLRGAHISMIFQDPMTCLNPLQRISDHVIETIRTHRPEMGKQEARKRATELIDRLGIMAERLDDYPHQLSGGMRQRVMIGLALALNADLIIADEPTTSLDVIVEAQFLDLLRDLQRQFNLTIILITHNIGVVAELSDRVAVMYAGKLVELADVHSLFDDPLHPYTRGLLNSVPNISLTEDHLQIMDGSPPDLISPPPGCRFHPRCPYAKQECSRREPAMKNVGKDRLVACWLY